MSKLPLTFACALYDRAQALYTGDVQAEGIDLNFIVIDSPREIFDRMAGGLEFGAAEFSSSEFIARMSANKCPFVALPVFMSRVFRHSYIVVNRRSGIKTAKDLEGKRVGVPLYTQTAAVWLRGILQHEYGVDLSKIHWVQGAMNVSGSHGSPKALALLKPVSIEINRTEKSLGKLLEDGELDATMGSDVPRSLGINPDIVRLFPDFREIEKEYYKRTRIFPIMHLVAIRRDIYEKHPFVATSLYKALCKSREIALARMRYEGALRYMLPWLGADLVELREVFPGGDPWPYGIEPNRPTIEALVTYLAEQHMIAAPMPVEDLFVPVSTFDA